MKRALALFLLVVVVPGAAAGVAIESPRGSITIDRIAAIKYPTSPAWSPDGKMIAFLWDAAGKQDLFVVVPGGRPQALTNFDVDPDLLLSDISSFAWISNDQLLFGKDGQLWTVSTTAPKPMRLGSGLSDAASFAVSPDRKQMAFLRRGQIWMASITAHTQRQLTQIAAPLTASVPLFSPDGRWLAFSASQTSLEPEELRVERQSRSLVRQRGC